MSVILQHKSQRKISSSSDQAQMSFFNQFNNTVYQSLKDCIATDSNQHPLATGEAMDIWCRRTERLKSDNATMFFIGNGASSQMAGHMSADAAKNGQIRAQAFHETSLMTAVSNDISFENVYAFPLKRFANPNDVLITISSSGNSPNIVKALQVAEEMKLDIITLSGKEADNKSRKKGFLNFYIPSQSYGIVECAHQVLLHSWLDQYMDENGLEI